MFIILTDKVSHRLKYALEEIFVHRLKKTYILTDDISQFQDNSSNVKIQYTSIYQSDLGGYWIQNNGFLYETEIHLEFKPAFVTYTIEKNDAFTDYINFILNKFPSNQFTDAFFTTKHSAYFPCNGFMPFDIFSLVFWKLSRYEEYQNYKGDKLGRFIYSQSLDAKNGIEPIPYIDIAIIYFANLLNIDLREIWRLKHSPTVDIDIAYKFLGRNIIRTIFSTLKYPKFLKSRIKTFFTRNDPYSWNNTVAQKFKFVENLHVFWLCSEKTNTFNKQVKLDYKNLLKDIKTSNQNFSVGLHPSANTGFTEWEKEKNWLENITGQKIYSSRQHFLILNLPETYQSLISLELREDWSMGYSDNIGFRAATSFSFRWFDLKKDIPTPFLINPFCFMDVTLKNYLKFTSEQSLKSINNLYDWISICGGVFCYILHNESLSSDSEWKDWQNLFENTINRGQN